MPDLDPRADRERWKAELASGLGAGLALGLPMLGLGGFCVLLAYAFDLVTR